jgi:hypothetical protein
MKSVGKSWQFMISGTVDEVSESWQFKISGGVDEVSG